MEFKTENIYPIYAIEDNCMLGRNGDVTYAYELHLPEIYSLSEEDFDNMHEEVIRFFRMFTRCVVHRQDVYLKKPFSSELLMGESFLQKATRNRFEGREYLEHRSYLYLSRGIYSSLRTSYLNCTMLQSSRIFHMDREQRFLFQREVDRAVTVFNTSGSCRLVPLQANELQDCVRSYLNGFERDCLTDIILRPELKIGDNYLQVFAINASSNLPAVVPTCLKDERLSKGDFSFYKGFLQPLGLDLYCNHVVNLLVFLEDPTSLREEVQKRGRQFRALAGFSMENKIHCKRLEKYLEEMQAEESLLLCRAHVNVQILERERERLQALDTQVIAAWKACGMTPYHPTYNDHVYYILCCIPGNAGCMPRPETFLTDQRVAGCFFDAVTNYRSDEKGLQFNERRFTTPVWVDDFYKPYEVKLISARNTFLIAPTGKGKSVLLNHILRQSVEEGFLVTLVELGASYEKLF